MKKSVFDDIWQAEEIAEFLDGNAPAQKSREIFQALSEDALLRETVEISYAVDAELGLAESECEFIPMTALAATCDEGNYCCLECEKYLLKKFDIEFDREQLLSDAIRNGWQKENGTALHNIGRHCEKFGLATLRRYKCSMEDIEKALNAGNGVIAAVDGGELLGNGEEERYEDMYIGEIPDHTVVVLSCNWADKTVTLFDPNSPNASDTYPVEQFKDAWADSKNYMVTVANRNCKEYIPRSIDLSDVELSDDLIELREAIAENAHEVWAENRYAEGWRYGPQRDDALKLHPDMVPYSQLPEGEKEYDREMAIKTIKLLKKLGWDMIKK